MGRDEVSHPRHASPFRLACPTIPEPDGSAQSPMALAGPNLHPVFFFWLIREKVKTQGELLEHYIDVSEVQFMGGGILLS